MTNKKILLSILGSYLYSDMSLSRCLLNDKQAIGLIFDVDKSKGQVWVMALEDTDCLGVHSPKDLPQTDALFSESGYDQLKWSVAEGKDWGKLLVNVCGCSLVEIVDGFEERCIGYSFDAEKANLALSKIGIDVGENGYVYWTKTTECNGNAVVVAYGEIVEESMPYADDEMAECRLRFVGYVGVDELLQKGDSCPLSNVLKK